jgi:hypothetical protein
MRVLCGLGALVLLAAGCASFDPLAYYHRPKPTFQDLFRPDDCHERYAPLLAPRHSSSCGTGRPVEGMLNTKSFRFNGVDLPEATVAEVLGRIQADVVEQARAAGAEIRGEVKVKVVDGVLRRFELAYRHGSEVGRAFGEVRPSERGTGWDLECVVAEHAVPIPVPEPSPPW